MYGGVQMEPVREVSYGLCILQMQHGDIRFLRGDRNFAEITGYTPQELAMDSFSVKRLIAGKARKEFVYTICKQMKERDAACVEVELLRKDFQSIHVVCCMSKYHDPEYNAECIQTVIQDITKEYTAHLRMQNQIEQDSMTSLYNKAAIERVVNDILDMDMVGEHAFYLIDIDNFKYINDTFGHVFGDTVIQDLAASVVKAFPTKAKVGRIGGDEFVVFLPDTNQEEARAAARRVENQIRREIVTEMELVQVSCSVGVAYWQEGDDYQALVKKADAAMYFAKDSGKNQSTFYQDFMMKDFRKKQLNHDRMQRGRIMEQTYDVEFVFFAYQLLTDSKQFDSSMNLLMERVVERFGLDRASVFEYQKQEALLQRTNTGANATTARMGESECYMEKAWLEKNMNSQGEVVINEVIPGENIPTFNNYVAMPKSFIICGIKEKNVTCGCVIFSQYQQRRTWNPYEIKTFHELSRAIAVFISLRRDRQTNMEEIHRLTTRDKITGLLDQKNFELKLDNYIRHCQEFSCLALVYVDINNFSYVNERYGTMAGDDVLSSFGKLLMSDKDTMLAGRLFSDCFLGLHIDENKDRAIQRITEAHENMLKVLRKKYPIASLQFKCGIYFLEDASCSVHEAIENANMARKSIKEDGSTNYCVYTKELRESRSREQEIIVEFLDCVKRDRIELYLQPSFWIDTRQLRGVEAFGRWHSESGVERKPEEFVPILKKNGYILEWDLAVYEKVLEMMYHWKEAGVSLPVTGINFSTADFQCVGIVKDIVALAEKYGIEPGYLVIEISEHGLRKAPKKVSYVLRELRKNGFKIAIDNFGTNYASMEMLVDESVDIIKTGKCLLYADRELQLRNDYLRYISGLVHSVNKEIIFVGAENEQQEQELKECGYKVAQGYLYEKELPAEVFEAQYIRTKEQKHEE